MWDNLEKINSGLENVARGRTMGVLARKEAEAAKRQMRSRIANEALESGGSSAAITLDTIGRRESSPSDLRRCGHDLAGRRLHTGGASPPMSPAPVRARPLPSGAATPTSEPSAKRSKTPGRPRSDQSDSVASSIAGALSALASKPTTNEPILELMRQDMALRSQQFALQMKAADTQNAALMALIAKAFAPPAPQAPPP